MSALVFGLLWNVCLAAILAVLCWAVCRLRPLRYRPALVHTLWLLVLVKLVTPPLIPLPVLNHVVQQEPADQRNSQPAHATGEPSAHPVPLETSSAPVESSVRHGAPIPLTPEIPWLLLLAITSISGTAILVFVSISRFLQVTRILHRAVPDEERLARLARNAAHRMGLIAPPCVLVVDAPLVPFLWVSFGRPLVVLPARLIKPMSDEQVRAILCHELAHYSRRDHWANLFAFVVTALFWWNPIAWWAWRQMRATQEICCDALMLEAKPTDRRCYAETLFQTLEFVQTCRPLYPSVASGFGDRSSLVRRFQMIATLDVKPRVSWGAGILAMVAVVTMLCVPVRGQQQSEEKKGAKKSTDEKKAAEKQQEPLAHPVPFGFEAAKLTWTSGKKLDTKEKIAFGEADHGLQLGVMLQEPAEYRAHDELKYELVIRNAGKEPVRFVFWQPQQPAGIVDSEGERVPLVWYEPLFSSLPTFISLAPEEAYRLKYSIALSPVPENTGRLGPWWESPQPGQYKLAVGVYLDIVPSDVPNPEKATQIFPRSAQVPLRIVSKPGGE